MILRIEPGGEDGLRAALALHRSVYGLKIRALLDAYGTGYSFTRFYTISSGENKIPEAVFAVSDGAGIFCAPEGYDPSELAAYLELQPDIVSLLADLPNAEKLCARLPNACPVSSGNVMCCTQMTDAPPLPEGVVFHQNERLDRIYPLLQGAFPGFSAPFDAFYADLSHRVRHGVARVYWLADRGNPAATASMVCRDDANALLGAVATAQEYRGRGYGRYLVSRLTREALQSGCAACLLCKSGAARRLYAHIGYTVCGQYGELDLKK